MPERTEAAFTDSAEIALNPPEFIAKWRDVELSERSACHEHFLDLCSVVEHPTPAEIDKTGEFFTFEKGAEKHSGGKGWADVWKKGFFGWEYKKRRSDLVKAYDQLLQYREALENPPLLVVCDMNVIEVHTNFTASPVSVHRIELGDLHTARSIEILQAVFHQPDKLKPGRTSEAITAEAAQRIADLATRLREAGDEPHRVARFLDRLVFCMFAEDIGLLRERMFTGLLETRRTDPERFSRVLAQLFEAMAEGGDFGPEEVRHFNGNLFSDADVIDLKPEALDLLWAAAKLDWSAVDPSIFGTLFERGLDPAKRAQLGAHYTSREDIETLVDPVVMQPLRREWDELRETVESLLTTGRKRPNGKTTKPASAAVMRKARREAERIVQRFLERLSHVQVLDPACGSGNFLYVTLQKLKDLEKEVIVYAGRNGLGSFIPFVGPWQLHGIEINPYAHELAQMTVWIGYLQWTRYNGFGWPQDPVLRRMDNFECKDAILDLSDPDSPKEPEWPKVDFIVGNPPFLGAKKLYAELGDGYVASLFGVWSESIPREADLCCYWFERARRQIEASECMRAGLLATQGIRGGYNREVLRRIKSSGDIFFTVSDRNWVLDGASVHVSMVGFDDGSEEARNADGRPAERINANLSATVDTTQALRLHNNMGIFLRSPEKGAKFDLTDAEAVQMLCEPNPNGRPNSDVLRLWRNAQCLVTRRDLLWIVDFAPGMSELEAAAYEKPFAYVEENVRRFRSGNRDERLRKSWWLHRRTGEGFREAASSLTRLPCTPMVSKHRLFVWLDPIVQPDKTIYTFARSDDYFFGVLHSRLHEVWALCLGTRLETRPRYTPTTCFETFPFLEPTDEQREGIAAAAKDLDSLRNTWLNPEEWTTEEVLEFPGCVDGPWARYVHDPNERGIGTVRYPRTVARDEECAKRLKKRTLTNLYNERPTWLDNAHSALDEAVFAAYGWPSSLSDEEILERLLALNLERAASDHDGAKGKH